MLQNFGLGEEFTSAFFCVFSEFQYNSNALIPKSSILHSVLSFKMLFPTGFKQALNLFNWICRNPATQYMSKCCEQTTLL